MNYLDLDLFQNLKIAIRESLSTKLSNCSQQLTLDYMTIWVFCELCSLGVCHPCWSVKSRNVLWSHTVCFWSATWKFFMRQYRLEWLRALNEKINRLAGTKWVARLSSRRKFQLLQWLIQCIGYTQNLNDSAFPKFEIQILGKGAFERQPFTIKKDCSEWKYRVL